MIYDGLFEVACPYCGEPTQVHASTLETAEDFVEDCSVCCRPMLIHIRWDERGRAIAAAERESD
jgi:hypothetical protein